MTDREADRGAEGHGLGRRLDVDPAVLDRAARIFRVLGDPTRVRISPSSAFPNSFPTSSATTTLAAAITAKASLFQAVLASAPPAATSPSTVTTASTRRGDSPRSSILWCRCPRSVVASPRPVSFRREGPRLRTPPVIPCRGG